ELENRLAAIQDLARKHNNAPEQLPDLTQQLSTELDELENAGQHLATLRQQHSEQLQAYREHAAALSKARHTAAERLGNAITAVLRTLGMPEADCHIHVQADADAAPSEHGTDRDELENAGQHLATLRQQHSEQLQAYREHAAALSKARHTAAERLGNAITAVLRTLGMPEADCHIHVQADADAAPSEHGTDR